VCFFVYGDGAMDCKTKIKELREMTGMNRKDFCKFFHIPYRTVTEWELDNRHAPEYVLRLLEYYIRNEGLIKSPAEQKHAGERSSSHEKTD
jgi:DNA-binding transcriptional regulator YiaG